MNLCVRVALVLFDVETVRAREQLPVQVAQVVARHVLAVLREVCRKAEVRRAMKARYEAFDDRARYELKRVDARQDFRREKARACLSDALDHNADRLESEALKDRIS